MQTDSIGKQITVRSAAQIDSSTAAVPGSAGHSYDSWSQASRRPQAEIELDCASTDGVGRLECTALPRGRASNSSDALVLFVNGVGNSERRSAGSAEQLAEVRGLPVWRIHNDREAVPYFGGVMNVLLSKFVEGSSVLSERAAVESIIAQLERAGRAGRPIEIHAHSQGSVIAKDSLLELERRLTAAGRTAEWEQIRSRLSVSSYGAAEHSWSDVAVREYRFGLDPVPLLTAPGDRLIGLLRGQRPAGLVELFWPHRHGFENYMGRMDQMFLKQFEAHGRLQGAALAEGLQQSIERGSWSDSVHQEVLRRVIEQDAAAARQLAGLSRSTLKRLLTEVMPGGAGTAELEQQRTEFAVFAKSFLGMHAAGGLGRFQLPESIAASLRKVGGR